MPSQTRYGSTELQVRTVNRDKRTIDFIASTFAKDSYGTRIDQSGWTFATKIPITWAHDDRGFTPSGGRPIGRAINLRVENGKLVGTAEFPKRGIFQFADECFDLAADGFIPATSVGFDPIEEETTMEEGESVPVYRRQKLLEIAFVTIPSNDEAQIDARAKSMNRSDEISDIQKRLKNVEEMAKELEPEQVEAAKVEEEVKVEAKEETPEVPAEPALPEAIEQMAQKMTSEYIQKCISYFEKKQPVNKVASKVLKKFYQIRGTDVPSDEADAWGTMLDHVGEMQDHVAAMQEKCVGMQQKMDEMSKLAESKRSDNVEDSDDKGNVENSDAGQKGAEQKDSYNNVEDSGNKGNVEDSRAGEVTTSSTKPNVEEAPQQARKAYVQLPVSSVLALDRGIRNAFEEAAAEALRSGKSKDHLDEIFAALEQRILGRVSQSQS